MTPTGACRAITDLINQHEWQSDRLLFNFTGGTKPMSIAGYLAAQATSGCALVYFSTDGKRSECYEYTLEGGSFALQPRSPVKVGSVLTLDLYLRVHGPTSWKASKPATLFETLVAGGLRGSVDELKTGVIDPSKTTDLDVVVRCENQVGIIEVKERRAIDNMDGMKQLSTYASPKSLGTYVKRILVSSRWPQSNIEAYADALNIPIIDLPSFEASECKSLSD